MDHTEAVGDEGLAEGGDLLGVGGALGGVLGGFLRVEANVLEQHNVAIVHGGDLGLGVLTVGVLGQRHIGAQQLAEAGGNRGQAQLRDDLALRAAEVGHEDDLGAFFVQGLDGRQSGLDSTVIGDGGAVQRNIEISKVLECLHEYPFLDEFHVKVANFCHFAYYRHSRTKHRIRLMTECGVS